jgi:hypothetical protein
MNQCESFWTQADQLAAGGTSSTHLFLSWPMYTLGGNRRKKVKKEENENIEEGEGCEDYLQGKHGKNHEAEHSECHDLGKLLDGVQQRVDYGLQA